MVSIGGDRWLKSKDALDATSLFVILTKRLLFMYVVPLRDFARIFVTIFTPRISPRNLLNKVRRRNIFFIFHFVYFVISLGFEL